MRPSQPFSWFQMFTSSAAQWLRYGLFLDLNFIIRKFIPNLCHSGRIKSCRISFELEINWTMAATGLSAWSYCSQAFPIIFHPRDWLLRYVTKKFVCGRKHKKWNHPEKGLRIRDLSYIKKIDFMSLNFFHWRFDSSLKLNIKSRNRAWKNLRWPWINANFLWKLFKQASFD